MRSSLGDAHQRNHRPPALNCGDSVFCHSAHTHTHHTHTHTHTHTRTSIPQGVVCARYAREERRNMFDCFDSSWLPSERRANSPTVCVPSPRATLTPHVHFIPSRRMEQACGAPSNKALHTGPRISPGTLGDVPAHRSINRAALCCVLRRCFTRTNGSSVEMLASVVGRSAAYCGSLMPQR